MTGHSAVMAAEDISIPIPRRRGIGGNAALLWLLPAGFYYALLLTAGSSGLFGPVNLGLTFNSMLLHLLQGRLDVDPSAIGAEGYLHGGAVYAYFGIFPALFRAIFLWLPDFATIDFTRIACLVAVVAMASAKLMSVRLLWRDAGARAPALLLTAMTAAVLVSGPQIQFLRPSVYQEVELWAGAQSAIFVYLVLRGVYGEDGFTPRLLGMMAVAAGSCLLTRVSNATGLYAALGLICLRVGGVAYKRRQPFGGLALPIAILGGFVALAALINAGRWGNPLVFADFSHALINDQYPERTARLYSEGQFSLARIGDGLAYYFVPFWLLRGTPGDVVACCAELPPSSFLVSDTLLLGMGTYGMAVALRKNAKCREFVAAAGLGWLVPVVLMLTAFGLSFRYRMEFYPFFELFAFLGFARLAARPGWRAPLVVSAGALTGIVTAHAMWMLYMLSPFGPAGRVLDGLGVAQFYRSLFQ
jgi:hypothetical protein